MAVKDSKRKREETEEISEATPSKKKHTGFSIPAFQEKLRNEECFEALEEFICVCRASKGALNPAAQFLRKGGLLTDILKCLDRNDNCDLSRASIVFSALHLVLLQVLTKVPEQRKNAEEACHFLLNNQLSVLHRILETEGNVRFKKSVLQLLTAVVTLNTSLAKDVLSYVNLSWEVVKRIVHMAQPGDPQCVRTCFIQFLMAFLVEGCPSIIQLLLDKQWILKSIIKELQYDSFKLVIFVLTTLRTKLVESREIPKTLKMRTFNTQVMHELLHLYKWKGPSALKRKWKKIDSENIAENSEQQNEVAEAVHALLVLLCTSIRYGVLFRDNSLGTSQTKPNTLVTSVLKEVKNPWSHRLLTDLFVQIVKVSPEFAPVAYLKTASVLKPRATSPWVDTVSFVTQVVASVKLHGLASLEPSSALNAAKTLAVPSEVSNGNIHPGLLHEHPTVRQKTIELLLAVLATVESGLATLLGHQAVEFRDHISKVLPNGVILEKAWKLSLIKLSINKTPPIELIPIPSPEQQKLGLIELMFLYQKLCPQLLEMGDTQGELTATLAEALDLNNLDNNLLELKVKILLLLSLLDTSVLDPGKDGFKNAIDVLLRASCTNNAVVDEAQAALSALLLKCKVLEPVAADMTGELGIWLQSYQIIRPSQRNAVISFLQEILICVAKNPLPYIESSLKARDASMPSTDIIRKKHAAQNDHADQLFQELLSMVNVEKQSSSMNTCERQENKNNDKRITSFDELASTVELSSVLMCVLDSVGATRNLDPSVEKYLSCVLVHLLHLQGDPEPFICLASHWTSMPSAVMHYLSSWLSEKPIVLTEPFGSCTPETSLSRVLLESGQILPELEDSSNPVSILFLERLVLFHVAQLAEKQQLTETVTSTALDLFTTLLHSLQETVSHWNSSLAKKFSTRFFNLILRHPVLLYYFSPLHKKKKKSENLVTNLVLNFLEKSANFEQSSVRKNSSVLLKEKLLKNILHYLNRVEHTPKNSLTLIKAVKILMLSRSEMCNIISGLYNKMMIQPWNDLLCHLLCNVHFLPSEQVTALGYFLSECLQKEDDANPDIWNVVDAFYQYLKRYPNSVHEVPSEIFKYLICERGLNLASVLLHHEQSLVHMFTRLVQSNSFVASSDVLCPLLTAAAHNGPLSSSLLKAIYKFCEQDIIKAMEVPLSENTCFENNSDVVQKLIVECIDTNICRDLIHSLNKNWKDLGLCTSFHLSVIHGLQVLGCWQEKAANLVQLLLHQINQMFQKKSSSSCIIQACSILGLHLIDDKINWHKQELQLEEGLPVLFLHNGLSKVDSSISHCLLQTFARLLWRAKAVKMAGQVFEMIISHSCFLDIVLVPEHAGIKLAVLQLLLTCGRLAPSAMKSAQIPIWLGAYGASLSHSDQTILKILQFLNNQKEIDLVEYRPFLWGVAAISHYSVRSRAGMSLWRIPQATAVLELLQYEMVERTIANFPIHRKLLSVDQDNLPETKHFISAFEEDLEPSQSDIYDPAFLMPLLSHIMAPESFVQDQKFSRFGGLAMTLATLGSKCELMRSAALCVLSRFYNRLDLQRPSGILHEQFIECIRAGIIDLKPRLKNQVTSVRAQEEGNKTQNDTMVNAIDDEAPKSDLTLSEQISPKVPNLSAIFLACLALVFSNPSHSMYPPLHKFILAKPAIMLKTVPELLESLRPSNVDFRCHQTWFLETIGYGIRTEEDVTIARGCHLYKMIFTLFSSCLADATTKLLILRVLEATLKIPNGTTVVMKCGLLPWLHAVFYRLEKEEEDGYLILAFIRLLVSLKKHYSSLCRMVFPLLLKLPPVVESSDIHSILEVVLDFIQYLTEDHFVVLLQLCQSILDQKIIQEYSLHLGIAQVNLKTCEMHADLQPKIVGGESSSDKRMAISDLLRDVVFKWLTRKTSY